MQYKYTLSLFGVRNLIKTLRLKLDAGAPFSIRQLREVGVSNALAAKYVQSGWLERLDRGVYQFAGDVLDRDRTLRFLEAQIAGLHVAGKSALARHGYRHNLAFDEVTNLWAEDRAQLPDWVRARFGLRFSVRHLFVETLPFEKRVCRLPDAPDGPLVSQPEPALLEMLSEVGVTEGLEESRQIMEGMVRLRPGHICQAVAACRMVKAVRLCIHWAREFNLDWAQAAHGAVQEGHRKGRWVARLSDGHTLTLPEL